VPGEVVSTIQAIENPAISAPVTLPWKDQGTAANGGQHPWRISGGFTSTVMLFNPDNAKANSVKLSIYAAGKTWTKQISIAAQATLALRLNDIIQTQEPDDAGNKLPRDSDSGMVSWYSLMKPTIFGQLIQADVLNHIRRPFACSQFTRVCSASIDNVTEKVGDNTRTFASAWTCGTDGGCACVENCVYDPSMAATFYNWSTSNANIASINNAFLNSAYVQGNAMGTVSTDVSAQDQNLCVGSGGGQVQVNAGCVTTIDLNRTTPFR
jgi:hypothetical protein